MEEAVYAEFWISLASLLRSYTALHGLSGNRQAEVKQDEERISVRHGEQGLELRRIGSTVSWQRMDGRSGTLEFTEAGQLRSGTGSEKDEEMDMAAESWAREIMQ